MITWKVRVKNKLGGLNDTYVNAEDWVKTKCDLQGYIDNLQKLGVWSNRGWKLVKILARDGMAWNDSDEEPERPPLDWAKSKRFDPFEGFTVTSGGEEE